MIAQNLIMYFPRHVIKANGQKESTGCWSCAEKVYIFKGGQYL